MSIATASISKQIYKTLRNAILSYEIKPGERMVEAKVAKKLNVSITPVREAFAILESQGLLTVFPYCGTYVTILSIESAKELIDVRKYIEPACAEMALKNLNDKDADYLEELCKIADIKNINGEFMESIESDIKFHEYIVEKSNNSLMIEIWQMIRNRIAFYQAATKLNNVKAVPLLSERHKKIVEGIREKDIRKIKKALIEHLDVSLNRGVLPSIKDISYK